MTTTHYKTALWQTACGTTSGIFFCYSENRSDVTCRRCLASLAKRDREFQRKARRMVAGIAFTKPHNVYAADAAMREDAARAVAREEGRAL